MTKLTTPPSAATSTEIQSKPKSKAKWPAGMWPSASERLLRVRLDAGLDVPIRELQLSRGGAGAYLAAAASFPRREGLPFIHGTAAGHTAPKWR